MQDNVKAWQPFLEKMFKTSHVSPSGNRPNPGPVTPHLCNPNFTQPSQSQNAYDFGWNIQEEC